MMLLSYCKQWNNIIAACRAHKNVTLDSDAALLLFTPLLIAERQLDT